MLPVGYLDIPDSESVYFLLLNSCSARAKLYVYFVRVQAISKMCFCTFFAWREITEREGGHILLIACTRTKYTYSFVRALHEFSKKK